MLRVLNVILCITVKCKPGEFLVFVCVLITSELVNLIRSIWYTLHQINDWQINWPISVQHLSHIFKLRWIWGIYIYFFWLWLKVYSRHNIRRVPFCYPWAIVYDHFTEHGDIAYFACIVSPYGYHFSGFICLFDTNFIH